MSAIDDKYSQVGGAAGFLGAPKGAEVQCSDPTLRKRDYGYGSIYFQESQPAAHEVHGDTTKKYYSESAETGFLKYPISDELVLPDCIGRVSHFNGGDIYWSPTTGAFEV